MRQCQRIVCLLLMLRKLVGETLIKQQSSEEQLNPELVGSKDLLSELLGRLSAEGLGQSLGITRQSVAAWKGKDSDVILPWIPKLAILHSELFGTDAISNVQWLYRFHHSKKVTPTSEQAEALIETAASQEPWNERLAVGEFRSSFLEAKKQAKLPNAKLLELASFMA